MAKISLTIQCDNYQTEQVLPLLLALLDAQIMQMTQGEFDRAMQKLTKALEQNP